MRRTVALAVLALVVGVVAGVAGASWWSDRSAERAAEQVRLVVTADDTWLGQLETEGCSTVALDVYNAGDRPVVVSALRASVTRGDSSSCDKSAGTMTVPPQRTVSFAATIGFRCEDKSAKPTFTATVGTSGADSVNGPIQLRRLGIPPLCQPQTSSFWVDSIADPEPGPSPGLPITLLATSPIPGAKLTALGLPGSKAFALQPRTRLPLDIGSLAPGAAPPEVRVEATLSVLDCERARELRSSDLTIEATFTPDTYDAQQTLGDRRDVLRLMRLLDAAC